MTLARTPYARLSPADIGQVDRELKKLEQMSAGLYVPKVLVHARSPYTVQGTDTMLLCDCTAGPITLTFPLAARVDGMSVQVVKSDTSTNAVTLSGTFSGGVNPQITVAHAGYTVSAMNGVYQVTAGVTDPVLSGETGVTNMLYEYESILRFGAKGNGTTDDSSAFVAAGLSLPPGSRLILPRGMTFLSNSPIVFAQGIVIQGHGATLKVPNIGSATALKMTGAATATTTTLSAQALIGAATMSVASSSGFAAGDVIQISSTENFCVVGASTYKKGELAFVVSVSAGVINLYGQLKDTYNVAGQTVTITKLAPITAPQVHGLTIQGSGVSTDLQIGIEMAYTLGAVINGCRFQDLAATFADLAYSDGGKIVHCHGVNANDLVTATGYAYSLSLFSQDCSVAISTARRVRAGFTTGSDYPVWNWSVKGCHFSHGLNVNSAGIVTHNNGVNGTIGGNTVDSMAQGITVNGTGCVIGDNIVSGAVTQGIAVIGDAPKKCTVVGNQLSGVVGIITNAYTGGTQPDVLIEDNTCVGQGVGATVPDIGISNNTAYAVVRGNRVRNHSPGIRTTGTYSEVRHNTVLDSQVGAGFLPFGIYVFTGSTINGVLVEGNRVLTELSSAMQNAVVISSGCTDTIVRDNDLRNATVSTFSDSGTRTRIKANWLDGVKQRAAGTNAAGTTNATTAGKAKTANAITYEINERMFAKVATDNLWDLTGVATDGTHFMKVLLCLDNAGAASIVQGVTSTAQTTALKPTWWPSTVCPVAMVEIPSSYAGGSLAGFTFYDLVGAQ